MRLRRFSFAPCRDLILALCSLVTAEEIFALSGIDHITLSAWSLARLQSTPLDEHFRGIRDRSLKHLSDDAQYETKDPFLLADLKTALEDPQIGALQVDALAHFGAAEVALRAIAKEQLRNM